MLWLGFLPVDGLGPIAAKGMEARADLPKGNSPIYLARGRAQRISPTWYITPVRKADLENRYLFAGEGMGPQSPHTLRTQAVKREITTFDNLMMIGVSFLILAVAWIGLRISRW